MFNKKKFAQGIALVMTTVMLLGAGMLSGCGLKEESAGIGNGGAVEETNAADQAAVQSKLMEEYHALLDSNPKVSAVIEYVDKNISKLSKENASVMLTKLEALQKKALPGLEEKYYSIGAAQIELQAIYKPGFDLNKLDEVKDQSLKDLLVETRAGGYKVETAEGMFFPVMNYEFYKKYSAYVTEDIAAYIDIMAVESEATPVKDAALMIDWEEIVHRAMAQEQFSKKYLDSVKTDDMKALKNRYITFMLFGANNTPLFSYDTKIMDREAKTVYLKAIEENPDSEIMQMLSDYMDILKKTEDKLSEEADKFRKAQATN